MKNNFIILIAIVNLLISSAIYAQVSTPTTNSLLQPQFVGFNGTGPGGAKNLDIRNAWAGRPINFFTGGFQRATILANGNVGIATATPDMPLHIIADAGNKITNSGWNAGLHLQNHAVLVWDSDGNPNHLLMGHPSFVPQGEFYCQLAPCLAPTGCPPINVYRIIGNPLPAAPNFTPPNVGDFEFFGGHNVLVDGDLGIGLDAAVAPLHTPTNRVEINTVSSSVNPIIPAVQTPNLQSAASVSNGFGGTGFSGLRFTDLTANSTPVPAANFTPTGVLSVDANGDIILVPGNEEKILVLEAQIKTLEEKINELYALAKAK